MPITQETTLEILSCETRRVAHPLLQVKVLISKVAILESNNCFLTSTIKYRIPPTPTETMLSSTKWWWAPNRTTWLLFSSSKTNPLQTLASRETWWSPVSARIQTLRILSGSREWLWRKNSKWGRITPSSSSCGRAATSTTKVPRQEARTRALKTLSRRRGRSRCTKFKWCRKVPTTSKKREMMIWMKI